MNRNTILIAIIIIVLLAAGIIVYVSLPEGESNENANVNTNAPVQITLPPDAGDITVDKQATYQAVDFGISTASQTDTFHSETAAEGEQYVVVFLKPLSQATSLESVTSWISNDVRLVTGEREVRPKEVKVVSDVSGQTDSGYLWFVMQDGDSDFTLRFGTGESTVNVDLGF